MKPVDLAITKPPGAMAPAAPADFEPLGRDAAARMKKPIADQLASADSVADEIEGSSTYVDDFGPKAVNAAEFATALRLAGSWSEEALRARAWATFAENCATTAWNTALGPLDAFKADFTAAVRHDPSIPGRYPELTAFVGARSAAAKRGAANRKKKGPTNGA
jgi:hypothetical protein